MGTIIVTNARLTSWAIEIIHTNIGITIPFRTIKAMVISKAFGNYANTLIRQAKSFSNEMRTSVVTNASSLARGD
jgi:hypothetical protein